MGERAWGAACLHTWHVHPYARGPCSHVIAPSHPRASRRLIPLPCHPARAMPPPTARPLFTWFPAATRRKAPRCPCWTPPAPAPTVSVDCPSVCACLAVCAPCSVAFLFKHAYAILSSLQGCLCCWVTQAAAALPLGLQYGSISALRCSTCQTAHVSLHKQAGPAHKANACGIASMMAAHPSHPCRPPPLGSGVLRHVQRCRRGGSPERHQPCRPDQRV